MKRDSEGLEERSKKEYGKETLFCGTPGWRRGHWRFLEGGAGTSRCFKVAMERPGEKTRDLRCKGIGAWLKFERGGGKKQPASIGVSERSRPSRAAGPVGGGESFVKKGKTAVRVLNRRTLGHEKTLGIRSKGVSWTPI